jgi:hypothetical protein
MVMGAAENNKSTVKTPQKVLRNKVFAPEITIFNPQAKSKIIYSKNMENSFC